MTLVQTQPRPARIAPTDRTVAGAVDEAEPQVWDDMTAEVALSVMASARAERLIVRDGDGRRTGLVTRAQLTAFRATSAYTDRVRLRDLLLPHGLSASPVATTAEATHPMRDDRSGTPPWTNTAALRAS